MYTDIATYSNDTIALLAEAPDEYKVFDESGVALRIDTSKVCKVMTIRDGDEAVSVIRADDTLLAVIQGMATVTILAEVAAGGDVYAAMNATNKATWDRIRGPLETVIDYGGGVTTTITGQPIPCRFAD